MTILGQIGTWIVIAGELGLVGMFVIMGLLWWACVGVVIASTVRDGVRTLVRRHYA